jgi:hypothetical protein
MGQLEVSPFLRECVEGADYKPVIERTAYELGGFSHLVSTVPEGDVITSHEVAMIARDAMTQWNKRMVKLLTTIGSRKVTSFITYPDFNDLDSILQKRVRVRWYLWTYRGSRGFVTCYVAKRNPWKGRRGQSVYYRRAFTAHYPRLSDHGPVYAELGHKLRDEDLEVKRRIWAREGENPQIAAAVRLRERFGFTYAKVAEALDVSTAQAGKWLKGVKRGSAN